MDDLVRFCQDWAKSHGYAIFKARSNAHKNVYIRCDRSVWTENLNRKNPVPVRTERLYSHQQEDYKQDLDS
ncbi:hypothetical protein PTTG_31101 [Puccinia triticina 1-1 BBBD Race 1]|uniref:Uncharacterized protein n=1 Tax=Puccinia triticina (isolate 1-1 / race 1 (BBBD)) TaxID=630390 RepID=A0A180FX56_PUCT1|nr:hypothetical protein PTTG_31101 [Puccinia triticina 1-1 BBBD Race 1]